VDSRSGRLVIVPCGSAKIWDKHPAAGPTPARNAYIGAPFKVNREYAERFSDRWVILSAKYGFLAPDDIIPGPYEVTFKRRSTHPISADALRAQVSERAFDRFDEVIALGGVDYRIRVEEAFSGVSAAVRFPFAGMRLGESLGAAKRAVARGRPLD
jgi:hypothetical protein